MENPFYFTCPIKRGDERRGDKDDFVLIELNPVYSLRSAVSQRKRRSASKRPMPAAVERFRQRSPSAWGMRTVRSAWRFSRSSGIPRVSFPKMSVSPSEKSACHRFRLNLVVKSQNCGEFGALCDSKAEDVFPFGSRLNGVVIRWKNESVSSCTVSFRRGQ